MSIAENIQIRKVAEECFDLMSEYLRESDIATNEGLQDAWRRVHSMIGQTVQIEPERVSEPISRPLAMSTSEADKFGRKECPFKAHKGKPYDEVPVDYLRWLCDQNADLLRYVEFRENEEYDDETDDDNRC